MKKKPYTKRQIALGKLLALKRKQLKDHMKEQGLLIMDIHIAKAMGITRITLLNLCAGTSLPGEWKLEFYIKRIDKLIRKYIK